MRITSGILLAMLDDSPDFLPFHVALDRDDADGATLAGDG